MSFWDLHPPSWISMCSPADLLQSSFLPRTSMDGPLLGRQCLHHLRYLSTASSEAPTSLMRNCILAMFHHPLSYLGLTSDFHYHLHLQVPAPYSCTFQGCAPSSPTVLHSWPSLGRLGSFCSLAVIRQASRMPVCTLAGTSSSE